MNIKAKIKERGFTISEVAALMPNSENGIGISQPTLSAIINGNPTINRLRDIANIIGIPLSELVADDSDCVKTNDEGDIKRAPTPTDIANEIAQFRNKISDSLSRLEKMVLELESENEAVEEN